MQHFRIYWASNSLIEAHLAPTEARVKLSEHIFMQHILLIRVNV